MPICQSPSTINTPHIPSKLSLHSLVHYHDIFKHNPPLAPDHVIPNWIYSFIPSGAQLFTATVSPTATVSATATVSSTNNCYAAADGWATRCALLELIGYKHTRLRTIPKWRYAITFTGVNANLGPLLLPLFSSP